jgi:nitroreductase/SAM-dependent methyltransferase
MPPPRPEPAPSAEEVTPGERPPGQPVRTTGFDEGRPVGPAPAADFWEVLYGRRSIRRFRDDPVPRELIEQILHAGIWAPSSCNYQMWDVVAVDDPALNARLAKLSSQMGNAPVNLVVSYGREFSEEGWANVQSASAMIQNMSLAAHVLGLGTFWITQMGDRETLRELVGLPYDRLVIAVLAVGYPKAWPKAGPKRRPLGQVTHWNHYAGQAIPSSAAPSAWTPELLAIYQRARVLNGLRHNKPRAWEQRALETAVEQLVPGRAPAGDEPARWLDVLPCTGILSWRLNQLRPNHAFDVVERTPEVAAFVSERTRPKAGRYAWPAPLADEGFEPPPAGRYALVSCLYRLEDLAPADRPRLMAELARWVAPDGRVLLGFVSKRSFHDWTERLRARRGGPRGVEYVLSPDPNIGPFEALDPREVERLARDAGLVVERRLGLQAVPQPEELAFRTRNFHPRWQRLARLAARALGVVERIPGMQTRRGRFQYLLLRRGSR